MTKIRYRSNPVWHETGMHSDGRPIVVAETPAKLLLRRKGTRMTLELDWSRAFLKAATDKVALDRIEKINARRAKRKGRKA